MVLHNILLNKANSYIVLHSCFLDRNTAVMLVIMRHDVTVFFCLLYKPTLFTVAFKKTNKQKKKDWDFDHAMRSAADTRQ